jgi:thioredoxin 1
MVYIIVSGFVLLLFSYLYFSYKKMLRSANVPENETIRHLTEQSFQHHISKGVKLVDFWADWCMPCKMLTPELNSLAKELPESGSVCKVNVDAEQQIAAKYGVRSIPTMILFKNGKEMKRFVGFKTRYFLKSQINNLQ